MEPLTVTLASSALASAALLQIRRLRARGAAWREAAESCGLRQIHQTRKLGVVTRLRGRKGRLEVSIQSGVSSRMAGATLIRVRGIADVAMRAERDADTTVRKTLSRVTEHQVGDPDFDPAVYLEGAPEVLQALLDASTRLAVRRLLQGMLYDVSQGTMVKAWGRLQRGIDLRVGEGDPGFARHGLPLALPGVLDLARRLELPDNVPGRLAQNAREDPLPEVRRRNLVMLQREFPDDPATARALHDACTDQDDEVRLHAALLLGDAGRPVLRELATSSPNHSCAARAIRGLGLDLSAAEALELLSWTLPQRRVDLSIACIEALAGRGGATTVAALERVLGEEVVVAVALAAARALGHPGLEHAEAALLSHGLVHAHEHVRAAAAEALGRVGTVEAVPPLLDVAARGPGTLRRAAQQAIGEIQSRLQGAAPGQLTMSSAEGGAVSLAPEGGEVSLDVDGGAVAPPAAGDQRPSRP